MDHYALDRAWEQEVRPLCKRLMVIDDLVDRPHDCDLLLDQSLGRKPGDYAGLVPQGCVVLAGTRYALLRPEFATLREYSLRRCASGELRAILISMGGVDRSNVTGQVLAALRQCELRRDLNITVVMGALAPWLEAVRTQAIDLPWPCEVRVDVNNMAQLMADSDLAIGAAGSTSWERCVLGLPALIVVLASNQYEAAESLQKKGAATVISLQGLQKDVKSALPLISTHFLQVQSRNAASLVDGAGVVRTMQALEDGEIDER